MGEYKNKNIIKRCLITEEIGFRKEVERLDNVLKEGKTSEVISEVKDILKARDLSTEQVEEFHALSMWGSYRRQDFEAVRREEVFIGENERGLRCLAAMENYLGNLEAAKKYLERMPDSPGKANTRMIGFRDPKDKTPREKVLACAFKWVGTLVDKTNTANLMNNTARWLLAKGSGKEDFMLAMGFMQSAVVLYGSGKVNLHHRAGANFWISKIAEKLFDGPEAAINAAEQSLTLWQMQLEIDPDNEHFKKNCQGAKDHLAELNERVRADQGKECRKEPVKGTIFAPVMTVTPYDTLITTTSPFEAGETNLMAEVMASMSMMFPVGFSGNIGL